MANWLLVRQITARCYTLCTYAVCVFYLFCKRQIELTLKYRTMSSTALENLETQLEMFIENVRQIRIIVSDFQPQGQSVLNQKMYV